MAKLACVISLVIVTLVWAADQKVLLKLAADPAYYISEYSVDFLEAYATCKRYGLELATEKTLIEAAQLESAIRNSVNHTKSRSYYMGGYRQDSGILTEWLWLETGESFAYKNWINTNQSELFRCLVKMSQTIYHGQWASINCNDQMYFICKDRV